MQEAVVHVSGATTKLKKQGELFLGSVQMRPSVSPVLAVQLKDLAGNTADIPLLDPSLFSVGVVAHHGPAYSAVQTVFFSRMFLVLFLLLMIAGLAFNVSITWHRQHHPAIVPILLLVYLSGALLFL